MIYNNTDIILCCYNSNINFLEKSINSILMQTNPSWELYIINDGSEKYLYSFLQKILDNPKIHYYENEKNIGFPRSLNIGHALGKSEFICWTSDDNYYEPNFVEEMLKSAIKNNFDFVRSFQNNMNINGEVKRIFDPRHGTSGLRSIIYDGHLGASHLYKRSFFNLTNGYDPELEGIEDLDMYYQIMRNNPNIGFINKVLYNYRVGTSSFSREKVLEARERFLKKWKI